MISLVVVGNPARAIVNADVTSPGAPIVGVAATPGSATSTAATIGTAAGVNNYPAAESPDKAIDNDTPTASKYLNFQKTNAGFITTLTTNGPQATLSGLRFTAGNDAPERDPATVVIEGTNAANPTVTLNSAWTQIYSGPSGLAVDPGRNLPGTTVTFPTSAAYSSFRVLVTGVRTDASANSFQFNEIELIGTTVPEPGSIALLSLGGLGLLTRRRRAV